MGWGPGRSHPPTAGATLYEVSGDHAVIYEDNALLFGSEKLRGQVTVRDGADGVTREMQLRTGCSEIAVDDLSEQTSFRSTAAETAIPQWQDAGSEANGDAREVSPPDADGRPAPPPVEVDLQQEGITSIDPYAPAPEPESVPPPDLGDVYKPAQYPEPVDAALEPDAKRRRNRKRLALVLIPVSLTVAVIVGASVLAALVLSQPDEMTTAETAVATPDVGSTISAAVAMAVAAQITPTSANPASVGESTAPPNTPPQSASLPQVPLSPPMPSKYVTWEQPPRLSETGDLVFRARIDEGANFTPAGRHCGLGNVSLMDNANAFYGSVIPRAMALPCGAGSSDWVSDRYHFSDSLLTVTVQLSSKLSEQRGLMVCLWTGGTDEENRLLDCAPVRRP